MPTSELDNYHYSHQLRNYIVQFAAIFAGMKVEIGKLDGVEPRLISIPIKNASMDRVVAHVKGENTQNKIIRLPLISFQLVNVDLAPELRKGVGTSRRTSFIPTGGMIPDDIKVVEQRMPVPYRAIFELAIWASNQDQHYQIMEQILTLFDPILQIQTSDDVFDWTRLTQIELTDIGFGENVPMGTDRRIIQTRLAFSVPVYLAVPAEVHNNIIKEINIRIGNISGDLTNTFDIISDLDASGAQYENVFSANNITIK